MEKTCFDCRYADIDPGSPDVWYLSNGDPGHPGEPPCAYCQDPLATELQEKYGDLSNTILCALSRADFPMKVRREIENKMNLYDIEDFAQFCPMFHQATSICKSCNIEFNGKETYCLECESKLYEEDW